MTRARPRLLKDVGANNYEKFAIGQAKQIVPINADGYIVTDGILLRRGEQEYTLSGVPASQHWVQWHGEQGGYDVASAPNRPRRSASTSAIPSCSATSCRVRGRRRWSRASSAGRRRLIHLDHDFIGRDALQKAQDCVRFTKVALVLDNHDARKFLEADNRFVLSYGRNRIESKDGLVGTTCPTASLSLADVAHRKPGTPAFGAAATEEPT